MRNSGLFAEELLLPTFPRQINTYIIHIHNISHRGKPSKVVNNHNLMALGEEFDSGMESQEGSAKEGSPEKKLEIEGDVDDEPDETLGERLWGLTEMFPEVVRTTTCTLAENTTVGIKRLYGFSRSVFWIAFSSSVILFAPVMFEVERAQLEEIQRNQQKQILLGPNTAMSGGGGGMPLMPPLHR